MRFFSGARCAWIAAVLCGVACAREADGPGLVWEIGGKGTTVWVAGSMHLLTADDHEPPATYRWVLARAGQVMMEIDPARAEAERGELQSWGLLPEGETLAGRLDGATREKLEARVGPERYKKFQGMRPLCAALTIALMEMSEYGAEGRYGLETWLAGEAGKRGWKLLALETPREQMALLGGMTAEEELAVLRHTLATGGDAGEEFGAMVNAWRGGREGELWCLVESSGDWPGELLERILFARNRAWAPRVEALLAGDIPTLVMVGAAHLVGPRSLVELLRAEGYQPRRLEAVPAGTSVEVL